MSDKKMPFSELGLAKMKAEMGLLGHKIKNMEEGIRNEEPPKKITFAEFEDLLLKQIGEAFDMSREALFSAVDPLKPPCKIQGYTAEQWQEIIDGGYLCEFSDFMEAQNWMLGILEHTKGVSYARYHNSTTATGYKYCRPAQLKGVMRPIFVEPVDKYACCHFINKYDMHIYQCKWREIAFVDHPYAEQATKYIEL